MRKKNMIELQRKTLSQFHEARKNPVIIVLDNVRSMHNVGSVFRTADAFLLHAVYLCGYTPQPPHRDINKTALGATESVSWAYFPDTISAIGKLKAEGWEIWAIEQVKGSVMLNELDIDAEEKIALVFGNEVTGVDEAVLKLCAGSIEIPQAGMKHSLNISVAAGIVCWEFVRNQVSITSSDT